MQQVEANKNIECSVRECQYHANHENYCSLDTIKVGSHKSNATDVESTDCESFEVKKS